MSAAPVDDVALLSEYDWEPACQSPNCKAGHPAATHFYMRRLDCTCVTEQLICEACVARIVDEWAARIHGLVRCADCSEIVAVDDCWYRLERLP